MFYSKLKNSFYLEEIHGSNIPSDSVEITEAQWNSLVSAQAAGKLLSADSDGNPIAIDPPTSTLGQLIDLSKSKRNDLLTSTDWLVMRHRDQVESKVNTTLTETQYEALQAYRTELRNLPEQSGFPNLTFPTLPV